MFLQGVSQGGGGWGWGMVEPSSSNTPYKVDESMKMSDNYYLIFDNYNSRYTSVSVFKKLTLFHSYLHSVPYHRALEHFSIPLSLKWHVLLCKFTNVVHPHIWSPDALAGCIV